MLSILGGLLSVNIARRCLIDELGHLRAVRVYREGGKSAYSDFIDRHPLFRKLLNYAERHEFDIVVVHKLAR